MGAPISELLYRLKIEGAEAVEARLAQLGETERREIERALQAAARKHDRADTLERQSSAIREQANQGIARTTALIEGTLPAYEAQVRAARNAAAAGGQLALAHGQVTVSAGQMRAGAQQLSFQISDVAQQFALGTPPMVIFAQQGAQVITAVQMMTGATGGLLGFLAGPWGAVLTGAAVVAGTFAAELFKTTNAIDEQIEKLRKSAAESEAADRAQERYRQTIEGVWAAISDQTRALEKQAEQQKSAAERANNEAYANARNALQIRETTAARIDAYKALIAQQLAEARAGRPGANRQFIIQQAEEKLAELQRLLPDANAKVEEQRRNLDQTRAALLLERAQKTEIQRIEEQTNARLEARSKELALQIGQRQISEAAARRELQTIRDQGRAEVERIRAAEQARTRAARGDSRDREFGRTVTAAEARRIAEAAGLRVNSAVRPTWIREERPGGGSSQERLYNRWVAQGRPADNPVARPGTSAHERGQALDIQATAGVTVRSIREAFEREGVRLTKVLRERNHFHVEFGRTAASRDATQAAREAAAADRERAQEIERLTRQYDPLTAAAAKYRDELAAIERLFPAGAQRDRMTAAVQGDYRTRRAGMLGEAIGIAGIARDADGEAARTAAFDREIERYSEGVRLAEIEIGLVGRSARERDAILSRIDRENALKREGRDLSDAQVQAILAAGDAYDQARQRLEALNDNWREGVRIGEQLVDNVLDPRNWDSWGDAGKRILEDLLLDMLRLAAVNPLKNALFGSGLPTFGGVFGGLFGSGAGGAASFADISIKGLPGLATGTASASAGWKLLGENGPEIAFMPAGARVMSSSQTRQAMNDRASAPAINMPVTINAPGADAAALSRVEAEVGQLRRDMPSIALTAFAEARQRNVIR